MSTKAKKATKAVMKDVPADRAFRTVTGEYLMAVEYPQDKGAGVVEVIGGSDERTFEGRVVAVGDKVTRFHLGQDVWWKPFTGYDRGAPADGRGKVVVLKESDVLGLVDRAARARWAEKKAAAEAEAGVALAEERRRLVEGALDAELPDR